MQGETRQDDDKIEKEAISSHVEPRVNHYFFYVYRYFVCMHICALCVFGSPWSIIALGIRVVGAGSHTLWFLGKRIKCS